MAPHGQCTGPHIVRAIGVLFDYQKSSVAIAKPIPRPDRLLSSDSSDVLQTRLKTGQQRNLVKSPQAKKKSCTNAALPTSLSAVELVSVSYTHLRAHETV